MTRFIATACVLVLAFCAISCGGPDSLMKKQISLWNDLSDAIDKKDADKVRRIRAEMKEVETKMKQLNLSPEEMKKLAEKYKGDLEKADRRFREAAEKDPEFMKKVDTSPPKGK